MILVGVVGHLPADAPRRVRRGRARGAARPARLHEPLLRPRDARGRASRGRCTRSGCCSASASTPRPRSRCSSLAGAGAAGGLPFYAILCLPILFAAGMSLFDTIDGAFMNFAYGWAFSQPVRKVFYNLTITGLSVAVALVIGTIELLSVLAERLGLSGGVWDLVAGLDLNVVGYAIVGAVRRSPGRSRWRCGASGASRSAGRRACRSSRRRVTARRADAAAALRATSTTSPRRVRAPAGACPRRAPARARGAVRRRGPGVGRVSRRRAGRPRPEVDLASVYRNLEQLEELGVVRHVHLGHGPGLYALVGGRRARVPGLRALRRR